MDCTNEKYSCPSSVNVADFVTVRPQLTDEVKLRSNFTLWREQMLCLLKSQDVVGFINGQTKEPQSEEQKLWRRIDSLVKGWILGSIGADVLQYVCVLETAREVWLELDYIFNFVFSAERGFEMKPSNLWPSSVNVAKFVMVRPQLKEEERSRNFNNWKEQMLCLLKSQDVVGFIEGKMVEPQQADEQSLWRSTDRLVKGWILGSIGADVLQYVCKLETAQEVWLELEYIFNFVFSVERGFKITCSDSWPPSANVAKFVTVRPQLNEEEEKRSRNFNHWLKQISRLLKSQDVVGLIEGKMVAPQQADDRLVKGWILGSIGADVLQYVCELETAREVWLELDYIFNFLFAAERGFEMKYRNLWPSSVNVAKFVKVMPQLNEEEEERSRNFNIWKEQMLCLLKSKYVAGFIEGEMVELHNDEQKLWGITDRLVKGWILGSIGTDVLRFVCELKTAREVWLELDYIFNFVFSAEGGSEMKDRNLWQSSVNVAKFVNVMPQLNEKEEERSRNFNIWKEEMLCLLKRQDVVGFIEGKMVEPQQADEQNLWRITDRLVKLWILGSVGTDVLQKVCYLKTAREVWLNLKKIFNDEEIDSNSTTHFESNIRFVTEPVINEHGDTDLHVAVRNKSAGVFVMNLVQRMRPEALAIRNKDGKTALHEAAIVGNTKAARAMLQKNEDLLYMMDDQFSMATDYAAIYGQRETLGYLISKLEEVPFKGLDFLSRIILCDFMDVALDLVKKFPDLARLRDPVDNTCALSVMATRDSLFASASRQSFSLWEKLIYPCLPVKQSESCPTSVASDIEATTCRNSFSIMNRVAKRCKSMIWKVMEHLVPGVKGIKDKKKLHSQAVELVKFLCGEMKSLPTKDARVMVQDSIMRAAEHDISEIVEVIMEMYPALTTCVNEKGWTIMHVAVHWRYENIFNVICKMSDHKHMFFNRCDYEGNSLLHVCARIPATETLNIATCSALQMQRELQWFNGLERFLPLSCRIAKNYDGETAKMLFIKHHKELKAEGERWMKDAANACTIPTALIATVVFAASFTVPGGVSSETGIPVFFEEPTFVLFATTNAVSLFTSITSLLLFLSILISDYNEQDFLHTLPRRLRFGLFTLFISIILMLVSFSAAFYLLFHTKLVWFIIPVTAFGWLPVASFVRLQFPLLAKVAYSSFGPGIFKKN